MRRIGIRTYLFLVLSLMSAAPVAWFGTVEASRLSHIAQAEADQYTRELAFDIARTAGTYLDQKVGAIEALAAQVDSVDPAAAPHMQRLVEAVFTRIGGFDAIYLANADGVSIVAIPRFGTNGRTSAGVNYSDRGYYRELKHTMRTALSGIEMGRQTSVPSLHVASPLPLVDGKLVGYATGSVSLETIRKLLLRCLESSQGVTAVIVDESSRIVVDSRRNASEQQRDVSASPLLHWTNNPESRAARDANGELMRASAVPIASDRVRWTAIALHPEAQTQVAARSMRTSTFAVSAWAFLGALIVAYLSSRLFARPITALVRATKRLEDSSDDLASSAPHWAEPQELAELSAAVAQLLTREQQHKASLNEQVRERTTELEAANRQLAVLAIALENAGDAICMTDAEGRIEWTNPAFRRITGYFPGESTGRGLAELLGITGSFFEFEQSGLASTMPNSANRGSSSTWRCPVHSRLRDGVALELDLAISPVSEGRESPTRFVAVARDVTAQRKAAQEIADSEARYRTLVEHAPEAVVVLDARAGHFVDGNTRAEQLFRRVRHHLLRTDIAGLSPPYQPDGRASGPAVQAHVDAALRGDTPFFDWTFIDSHGKEIPCEVRLVGLPGIGVQLVRASVVDISERLQREQERRDLQKRLDGTERLAGIGAVAAGVAHEINNPLAYILNNLDFALAKESTGQIPATVRDALVEAQNGALRVRDIVRDLKTFARVEGEIAAPVDVRNVVDASINIASSDLFHRARIEKTYQDVPEVIADPSRLGQVFLNLIVNAIQALPEGSPAEQLIRIDVRPSPDAEWVEVSVEDSGHGIPLDRLERIFEPFYTTKPIGKGTGLGLSISRNVITSLGGRIEVESQVNKGSKFTVILPVPRERQSQIPTVNAESEAPLSSRSLQIMVLDDDVMVARSIARILGAQHRVEICTRGSEALTKVAENQFDLVFCDVMMPEMNGLEFYTRLLERNPALAQRIVFMSGGLFIPDVGDKLNELGNPCISKPFQPEAVLSAVRRSIRQMA